MPSPKPQVPTLEQVIGRNLRRLLGTQDEAARLARGIGLNWGRSTIAALEAGTKTLDAGELLALALGVAPMGELLAGDGDVRFGAVRTSLARARAAFAGGAPDLSSEDVGYLLHGLALIGSGDAAGIDLGPVPYGEAEEKAARKFGVNVETLVKAAQRRWGRSMSAERDARVADMAPEGIAPRSRQALRGQVTRQLLTELEPALVKKQRK